MKIFRMGIVSAVTLMALASIGVGIAQAGGNPSDSPTMTLQEQEALGQGSSSSPYVADLVETGNLPEPTQIAMESVGDSSAENPEDQEISQGEKPPLESAPEMKRSGTDWQTRGAVEVGSLPEQSDANDLDHSDVPREGDIYRYWGSDNPSN
jgi:hypothetical protein